MEGRYWTSSTKDNDYVYRFYIANKRLAKDISGNKRDGNALRCVTRMLILIVTQSVPVALIIAIRFNQACTIHRQAVTSGATNYTRRPVDAIQRLVVKPTRTPVIVTSIYIRQWIRSCTKATSGEENLNAVTQRRGKPKRLL